MEEAPLIVKKTIMGDKCASCNQLVINPGNSTSSNYHIHLPSHNSMNFGMNHSNNILNNNNMEENITTRYKLRTIQDNSNKYGTGSYSRILSNVNAETLNEDLKPGNRNQSNNKQLPDINKNEKKKLNDVTPIKFRKLNNTANNNVNVNNSNSNLNNNAIIQEGKEKMMNIIINDELEKAIINPENLIKASNKFAEGNNNNVKNFVK